MNVGSDVLGYGSSCTDVVLKLLLVICAFISEREEKGIPPLAAALWIG